tara:strand:- start:270 stop:758 length:489 start_codon:yes stop_codon:yes gene_type:complete
MAVTTEYSSQYTESYITVPAKVPESHEWMGRLRIGFFEFTQGSDAGDAGSLAYLVKLPAGKVRLILPLSRVHSSALGSSRTMDLGWIAYTDDDGASVSADPNGLDDGVDVSSAVAFNPGGTVGTHETYLFESQEGVVLTAQVNDGTLPAAATIKGYFVYVID